MRNEGDEELNPAEPERDLGPTYALTSQAGAGDALIPGPWAGSITKGAVLTTWDHGLQGQKQGR